MISYDICFSDLFQLVLSLGPFMLLQMTFFHPFLKLSNIPVCVYAYHIFFIQLSVNGHLGCFCVLTIVNSAVVLVLYFSEVCFFPRCMLRNGTSGSYGRYTFSFLRNLHTVLLLAAPIYIPTKSLGGFSFLHTHSII